MRGSNMETTGDSTQSIVSGTDGRVFAFYPVVRFMLPERSRLAKPEGGHHADVADSTRR